MSAPTCPYCGAVARMGDNAEIYGRTYGHGKTWFCANYPACSAFVGAHPNGVPLGTLANRQLREARKRAHAAFDPLWRDGPRHEKRRRRARAYGWMRVTLELPEGSEHIAMLDEAQCERLIAVVAARQNSGWTEEDE